MDATHLIDDDDAPISYAELELIRMDVARGYEIAKRKFGFRDFASFQDRKNAEVKEAMTRKR